MNTNKKKKSWGLHLMTYTNEKKKKVEGGLHRGTYTNEEKKSGRGHTPGDVYKQD